MGAHAHGSASSRTYEVVSNARRSDLEMMVIATFDLRSSEIPEWADWDFYRQVVIDLVAVGAGEIEPEQASWYHENDAFKRAYDAVAPRRHNEQENDMESAPTAQHTDVCRACGGTRDYAGQSGWVCRTEGCANSWAGRPENSSQSEDSKVDVCGDSMETAGIEPAKGNAQSCGICGAAPGEPHKAIVSGTYRDVVGALRCDELHDAEVKRLPVEWMERNHPGYAIYDPDGWRDDGKSMFDPITEVEFERRFSHCTVGPNTWAPTRKMGYAPEACASASGPLTFRALRAQNVARKIRWHGEADDWSGADWSNAMAGECGEACNIVKKLRRHETGTGTQYNTPGAEELLPALADELADVVTYCDLLAYKYGIDLGAAVRAKFNRVSAAQDFPERL